MGLMIVIIVVSCQRPKVESLPGNHTPQTTQISLPTTDITHVQLDSFDFQKALRLMFESPDMMFSPNLGQDTVAVNTAIEWSTFSGTNPCEPMPIPFSPTNTERFECTGILLAKSYYQDEVNQILVLTETITGECHICTPQISGAVFLKQEGDWVLDFKQLNFLSIGSWGQAPAAEFIQIGEGRFGILFRHNFASTSISGEEIVITAAMDREFNVILRVDSALRNAEEGWGYDSKLAVIQETGRDWYDIQITTTGTKPASMTQSSVRESFEDVKWFTWDGSTYKVRDPN